MLIDGDRFRTESPEAIYEGIFNINVEAQPHEIDIEFVAGPEAGNWNFGIYRLDGDTFELCLDLNGRPRPVLNNLPEIQNATVVNKPCKPRRCQTLK